MSCMRYTCRSRAGQGERNYIMQVVCEATQNPSVAVQVGAFECLVKIMALYYDKMAFYMEQALFGVCGHQVLNLAMCRSFTSS